MTALAPILQAYFTQRLAQRQASPHTVASYRDTFSLLLRFAQQQLGTPPSRLDLTDVDAALVGAFLDHLETGRGHCAATRNNRLAAVHSLFSYAALRCPEHAATIARVLAIPPKRTDTTIVCFLTQDEVEALLASPDRATHPARPTRSPTAARRGPNRAARLRAHRPHPRRRHPGPRREPALPRQGAKGTLHAADRQRGWSGTG